MPLLRFSKGLLRVPAQTELSLPWRCRGLPPEFEVTRYHSLAIERDSLPTCLKITAQADDGEIMGLRHASLAVEGVQFHPEALLTEHGHRMLQNFIQGAST